MPIHSPFRNIIFDLGGVLFNLDYQKTIYGFLELGAKNFREIFSQQKQVDLFSDYEKGKIITAEFNDGIRALAQLSLTDIQIRDAWNAMLLGFPEKNFTLLGKVKKRYRLFLLSNTNELHFEAVMRHLNEKYGAGIFQQFFEAEWYSHRVGMRKPDPEIFRALLTKHSLHAAETIFIDDSPQHVEGARMAGLNAEWLAEGEDIRNLLVKRGILPNE
jgi:putative hydrolase of the HAD superfamily